jgi:hypothetical protein
MKTTVTLSLAALGYAQLTLKRGNLVTAITSPDSGGIKLDSPDCIDRSNW